MTLTTSELRSGGHGEEGKERKLAVGSGWCTAKVADRLIGKSELGDPRLSLVCMGKPLRLQNGVCNQVNFLL
jgi:hypothetical protein